jgi:hypothetical protein
MFALGLAHDGSAAAPAKDAAAVWKAECASCHMAYHPGLLPERSWRRLMGELDKHFGENASLDAATGKLVLEYLVANSAERNTSRRSSRFLASIPSSDTPLRISETPYFVREHREVRPDAFKLPKVRSPANCVACHSDADEGAFSGRNARVPR